MTPNLRLFLSVDISGSTALKNRRNHSVLLQEYRSREIVLRAIREKLSPGQNHQEEEHTEYFNDDLQDLHIMFGDFARENIDWAVMLERRFQDFHVRFGEMLNDQGLMCQANSIDIHLWKALGDELIYCFEVENINILQSIVKAFLEVVIAFDKKDVSHGQFRLKSSAWVAGFPVRNREVTFPGPQLYTKSSDGTISDAPYPRMDFLGPDMDTGFRLGSCTHPGLMTLSVELSDLLSDSESVKDVFRVRLVGWKVLKGVWNDAPYPVIWISTIHGQCDFSMFYPWAESNSAFIEKWLSPDEYCWDELRQKLSCCRTCLPTSLGLVEPYIVTDPIRNTVPSDHKKIHRLLEVIYPGIGGKQSEVAFVRSEGGRTIEDADELASDVDNDC